MNEEFMRNSIWNDFASVDKSKRNVTKTEKSAINQKTADKELKYDISHHIKMRNFWNTLALISMPPAIFTILYSIGFILSMVSGVETNTIIAQIFIISAFTTSTIWAYSVSRISSVGKKMTKLFCDNFSPIGGVLSQKEKNKFEEFMIGMLIDGYNASYSFITYEGNVFQLTVNWKKRSLSVKLKQHAEEPEREKTVNAEHSIYENSDNIVPSVRKSCFELINLVDTKETKFVEATAILSGKVELVSRFDLNVENYNELNRVKQDLDELLRIAQKLETVNQLSENLETLFSGIKMLTEEVELVEKSKTTELKRSLDMKLTVIKGRSYQGLLDFNKHEEVIS